MLQAIRVVLGIVEPVVNVKLGPERRVAPSFLHLLLGPLLPGLVLSRVVEHARPRPRRHGGLVLDDGRLLLLLLSLDRWAVALAEAVVQLSVLVEQIQLERAERQGLEYVEKGVDDLTAVGAAQGADEEAAAGVVLAEDRLAGAEVGEPGIEGSKAVDGTRVPLERCM